MTRRIATLFFLPLALILIVKVLIPWASLLHSTYLPKAVVTPKPINVLEIRYFPNNPVTQGALTDTLSSQLQSAINEASEYHAYSNPSATAYVQVVMKRTIERDRNSPLTTGVYSTDYHSMDTMLTGDGEDLCDYIVDNNIDQVWFWKDVGDDTGGFNQEYYRIWSSTHFPVQAAPPLCGGRRSFIVMGLDQNRAVGEALHSFGHSMESVISQAQGYDLFWTRFTGKNGGSPPYSICGNVHFPPNGLVDYDYSIATQVTTACEDWHPDGTGTTSAITCSRWGCDELGYLKWWFQSMPNDGNTLTYVSKTLPNWWDFVSETDTAVTNAKNSNLYLSPYFIDTVRPSYIDSVSGTSLPSGTSVTFSQTVAGANRLFMLGASYRSPSKSSNESGNEQITAVTIGSTPLTRVRRTIFHEYTTELWYVVAPPLGTNTVTVTFASGAQDEAVAGVSFIGVDQTTPFDSTTGYQAGTASFTTNPTISIPSTASQALFGVVSMYTGDNNDLGVSGATDGIWGMRTTNVISKGAVATGGSSSSLSWDSLIAWPWSISAVAINIIQPTPTPAAAPTMSCNSICTTNDQCPLDLICASGQCRRPGCTALDSCTCGPSCNSACTQNSDCPSDLICQGRVCRRPGCTALDTCNCGTPAPTTFTPVQTRGVQTKKPASAQFTGKLLVNGIDSANHPYLPSPHITVDSGSRPVLRWTTNSKSCVASGGWSGKKAANGSLKVNAIQVKTLYKLLCTMPNGSVYPLSAAVYVR